MKKYTLFTLFCLIAFALFAQKVPKHLLVEHFTSANCLPCAGADPVIQSTLKKYANKLSYLRLQFNAPRGDIMFDQNPTDVLGRSVYYNVYSAPTVLLQGKIISPYTNLEASIIAALSDLSAFALNVSHIFNVVGDTAFMTVTVKAVVDYNTTDTLKLVFSLNEDLIDFEKPVGSNGEREFPHVMRKLMTTPLGMTIKNNWLAGDSTTYTMAIPVPDYIYHKDRLECLAFIQSSSSKEILQSAFSSAYRGPIVQSVFAENIKYASGEWRPTLTILNDFKTETISSLRIKYQINDTVLPNEVTWTGALQPNKTLNLILPDVAGQPIYGTNVLNLEIMADDPEYFPGRKATINIPVLVFDQYQTTPSGLEDFNSGVFPPVGYLEIGEGIDWVRDSNAGNVFMKAPCQNQTETSAQFYLPPQKITENNALISFSVAYACIKNRKSDTLNIQISDDDGKSWTTIYSLNDKSLETVDPTTNPTFTPSSSADWKNKRYSLQDYAGKNVLIRFLAISRGIAPIYVDSIFLGDKMVDFNISCTASPSFAGIVDAPTSAPAMSYVTIKSHVARNGYYFHYWMDEQEELISGDSVYTFQIKTDMNFIAFFSLVKGNQESVKVFTSYNNPVHDMLILTTGDQVVDQLTVYDLNGKELCSQKPRRILSNEKIDLTGLPSGFYLVKAKTSEGIEIIKICKQ